ncbi:precorrin-6Y C5,15-methyltransferase (decarboxylating) [Saccharothrix tamanrassetensis]|uniref:Precorrin-6Y C5,15-methyltransferase (Decarboxylating) n=1 Tax=Saccharothrix tamanrassetensis TaxID=1051531 RepID=A0A841CHG1_9PSEU|nr:precorrin-6y C5,15-methyltransferase (decarboxylating) subunit CbiE [Saccharothrix tamanrassetensis]MBB5955618.1 precorrin-6Y C5,15-methyltransferase (decarboxylating) [Saccharothrix tamanrassetensis]
MDVVALHGFLAQAGRSWESVTAVDASVHGLRHALNVCRARPAVAVAGADPAELARGLAGWRRTLTVADESGLSTVDPADAVVRRWVSPGFVLCVADGGRTADGGRVPAVDGWALPDDDFAHRDGMVATAEVRALALSRLAPRPGVLVWDVGAGPGSIGVECARLGAAVVAVEQDPVQCVRIIANASAHGVDVRVVESPLGEASDLPRPDAVFVGGGGPDVVRQCARVGAARIVVATPDLERVVPARDALLEAAYEVEGSQLSAARLTGGTLLAVNPVTVLWGAKKS